MLPAILSFAGYELTDNEKRLFKKYNPIGFHFFTRNIESKSQTKKLIKDIQELLERDDIIFAIDQEGGRVRRLREPEFRSYLPQYAITTPSLAQKHAYLISSDLKELGFNLNYAPVLDVLQENTNDVLKSRCLSHDETVVAKLGKVMVDEYTKCGVSPCIKHLPGHGRGVVDPHLNLPVINASLNDLEKDFYPFIINNHAPTGMTAHIVVPAIDDKLPVTMSKKAIDTIIRGRIGFDGFLLSDSIEMKALAGALGERAQASLSAGCDAIIYAYGKYEELVEICANCSRMTDYAMERLEKVNRVIKQAPTFDSIKKTASEYEEEAGKIELYNDTYDATEILNKMVGR